MFKYETHMHTSPVSKCAKAGVRESVEYYRSLGYDGIFITNHFPEGRVRIEEGEVYADRIERFFSDYEEGVKIGKEIGIKVFSGLETTVGGTDFLIYGLDKSWYLAHPEITEMRKSAELPFLMENGALVIQAHPFREAGYIDHIRLFPRCVHGVEVINACRTEGENAMAKLYADHYGLLEFAGTDNHIGARKKELAGMCCDRRIENERDFADAVKNCEMQIFYDILKD